MYRSNCLKCDYKNACLNEYITKCKGELIMAKFCNDCGSMLDSNTNNCTNSNCHLWRRPSFSSATYYQENHIRDLDPNTNYDFNKMSKKEASDLITKLKGELEDGE